jgi:hypothetical protein
MSHTTQTVAPLAVDVSIDIKPEAGVPFPVLFQTEDETVLIYRGYGVVIAHFDRCIITRFGYPNDEALGGHPLYARGLQHYGVFEVHGSSWPSELEAQNRRVFPDSHAFDYRHFIFTFHDSTFECLAVGVRFESFIQPLAEVVGRIHQAMCARL